MKNILIPALVLAGLGFSACTADDTVNVADTATTTAPKAALVSFKIDGMT